MPDDLRYANIGAEAEFPELPEHTPPRAGESWSCDQDASSRNDKGFRSYGVYRRSYGGWNSLGESCGIPTIQTGKR